MTLKHYLPFTLLFLLVTLSSYGQSGSCSGAEVFCGSSAYSFPASVSTTAEPGPCYNQTTPPCTGSWPVSCPCLSSTPNPAWYFMQAGSTGQITITMTGLSTGDPPVALDIDFICWGPFTSPTGACPNGLTCDKVVSCSYSNDNDETCIIPNAIEGEFYMLLITNYSNDPANVSFQQANIGEPGSGSTNCNIVVNCGLLALSPTPTPCDPLTGLYTLNGIAEFTNPPTTGELIIRDLTTVPPTQISFTPPFVSPLNFSIPNLTCDGLTHNMYAYFSGAGNTCELSANYTAPPEPCPSGVISGGGPICDDGTSQTSVNIVVSGAPGPFNITYAFNGVNQPEIINYPGPFPLIITTGTPGVYTLVSTSNSNCSGSSSGSAEVILVPFPNAPVAGNPSFYSCGTGTVTLSVTDNPGLVINWYDAATGGTPLFTGNPFTTPVLLATTTFYAEAETILGNCKSIARTPIIATVRPVPSAAGASPIINCSLDDWTIPLSSSPAGASFTWAASCLPPGTVTGFGSSGAGNTIGELLSNISTANGVVTYVVTPILNECSGPVSNFTVSVKPVPHLINTTPPPVCSGSHFNALLQSDVAGGNFTWTATCNPFGAVTGFTATQTTNTNTISEPLTNTTTGFATVIYHITPHANGCDGPASDYTVTVNPTPHLTNPAPTPICSESNFNSQLLCDVTGGDFTWTATSNPAGAVTGFTANQTTAVTLINEPLTNTTINIATVTYLVIPHANGCSGTAVNYIVSINPEPVIVFLTPLGNSQNVCSGTNSAAVFLQSNVTIPGVTYAWTATAFDPVNPTTAITGFTTPNSGSSIPGENIESSLLTQGVIKYTITPTFTANGVGCPGAPEIYSVFVNPAPTVSFSPPSNLPVCSGASSQQIDLLSNTPSTTFSWQALEIVGVSGAVNNGLTDFIPAQTLSTTSSAQGHVKYQVTPIYQGGGTFTCPGGVSYSTIFVNPLPEPAVAGRNLVCELQPDEKYNTPLIPGNSYSWTITGAASVVNANSSEVAVTWGPYTNSPGTLAVTETINATGCQKTTTPVKLVTLQQRPIPGITGPVNFICEGSSGLRYETEPNMTNYTWVVSGGTITSGGGPGNNFSIVTWNSSGSQSIEVNYLNTLNCPGFPSKVLPVTVHPLPATTITEGPGPHCVGATHTYMVPDDPQCSYVWSILPASRGTISGGQNGSTVAINWLSSGPATLSVTGTNTTTSCSSSNTHLLDINPKPNPSFIACFDLVTTPNAKNIQLKGASPYIQGQGVFSGNRVILNASTGNYEFNPSGAGSGSYPITYTYTNNFGCTGSTAPVTITVQNNSFSCGGIFIDPRDGKSYRTAMLSGKCWMRDNLNYGTAINTSGSAQTNNCIAEKFCAPTDLSCSKFGGMYQWNELMQYSEAAWIKGICPPEWHVPSETEWQSLIDNLITGLGPPHANANSGGGLKDPAAISGFNALLGGINYNDYFWSFYSGLNTGSMYWTSTPYGDTKAIARGLNIFTQSVSWYQSSRGNAFSLRCIKD